MKKNGYIVMESKPMTFLCSTKEVDFDDDIETAVVFESVSEAQDWIDSNVLANPQDKYEILAYENTIFLTRELPEQEDSCACACDKEGKHNKTLSLTDYNQYYKNRKDD